MALSGRISKRHCRSVLEQCGGVTGDKSQVFGDQESFKRSHRANRNESWHYLFTNCSAKCSNTFVTHSSEDGSLS